MAPVPNNRTKSQHYTPQLHLKNFEGPQPKGMIWTYDCLTGRRRPSKVLETGFQSNYYSRKRPDGTYDDSIDEMLEKIENLATPIYDKLLSGRIPTDQEKMDFAGFLATQFIRSPAMITARAEAYAQFVELIVDIQTRDKRSFDQCMDKFEGETGKSFDRDELYKVWNDKDRYRLEVNKERGFDAFNVAPELAQIMFERPWYLLTADADYFITCDNPVVHFVDPGNWPNRRHNGGWNNPFSEITFPLSPSLLLMVYGGECLANEIIPISAEAVWAANEIRAAQSERFLFAHLQDSRISDLGATYKDDKYRIKIGHHGPGAEIKVVR